MLDQGCEKLQVNESEESDEKMERRVAYEVRPETRSGETMSLIQCLKTK